MASIERRPGRPNPWRVRYRAPDGKSRSRQFPRKIDAERFLAGVAADLARGSWVDPQRSRTTVREWCEVWRRSKVDLRPSTLARLDSTLQRHVLPAFGGWALDALTNGEIRAWVARMNAAGLSPTSVRKPYFALHDMLRSAVADRRLAVNPAQDVPLPAERHGGQRFLSSTEVARLTAAVHPRHRVLVLTAVYGGLRFGELTALRRGRIDIIRGRVRVAETLVDVGGHLSFGPPKTQNSRRSVPLPRRIVAELDEHLGAYVQDEAEALVFSGPRGGPLRRGAFRQREWLPAVHACGLEGLRFHDLRHTFVSLWIAAGANPKEVSVRAGHSSVAFTLDRYGHLYEDGDDAVSDRLDALLGAARRADDAPVP